MATYKFIRLYNTELEQKCKNINKKFEDAKTGMEERNLVPHSNERLN
jgi:hypothetical protein